MTDSTVLFIVAGLGVGWVILCSWLIYVTLSLRKINKREQAITEAGKHGDFVAAVEQSLEQLAVLHEKSDALDQRLNQLSEVLQTAVQKVGVIRFDAFEDIGGKQSFSVALLDSYGNGVVVSGIIGRQESRSYAKPVVNGTSEFNLSTEEEQAIKQALGTTKLSAKKIKTASNV